MITLRWFGHSCFLVSGKKVTLVIDPFEIGGGLRYPPIDVTADVLLVSHEHHDHNNVKAVRGSPRVIRGEGNWKDPVPIVGVATSHGPQRGSNTVFRFEVDDISLCHLGDLGEVPAKEELSRLKPVDVLMIPVGGTFTIDAAAAHQVVRLIEPRLVIPMHYRTKYVDLPLSTLEPFTRGKRNVRYETSNIMNLQKDSLPEEALIVVLPPPAK